MAKVIAVDTKRSDGVAFDYLQKLNTDIPIALVSRSEDLCFNEEILALKGCKWLLVDYVELGWEWNMETSHHFGQNLSSFPEVFRSGWDRLEEFMKETPPILTFQRELLKSEVTDKLLPISYPCFIPPVHIQTKEEFDNRLFEVLYTFGISNEYRKELHGEIWKQSGKYGYSVMDNLFTINQFLSHEKGNRKWGSVHIPHYARSPIETITDLNGHSKISVSLSGAGKSCFRHSESPVNSVMLMTDTELAWSHKWEHDKTCLMCEEGKEIETAIEALKNPNLYEIYKAGVEHLDKYRIERYCKEYIEPLINKAKSW